MDRPTPGLARHRDLSMVTRLWFASLLAGVSLSAGIAWAATATYDYDALGRLTRVTYSDGKLAIYKYDAAGNRTLVASGTTPGVPTSITVPASSGTGNFTIGWVAASGTVTVYKLYQASNSGFFGQTLVYSGTALSVALTGRAIGTYYYRVQGCLDVVCGGYRTGANSVTVTGP